MKKLITQFNQVAVLRYLMRWFFLLTPVAFVVGSLVALFLYLLDYVTTLRWENPWLLYLLPLVGIGIVFVYKRFGKNSDSGNNLVMDEIHEPGGGVPWVMTPLVLVSTVLTHLFGGSAGREGTAVQMGGSIAGFFAKVFRLPKADISILLIGGVAAGFGAVFGTPLAGAVFSVEVLSFGKMRYQALFPAFLSAFLADRFCVLYGVSHTQYAIKTVVSNLGLSDYKILLMVILAGVLFGLTGYLFSESIHRLKAKLQQMIRYKYLLPLLGGVVIIALVHFLGTRDYLGLGVYSGSPAGLSIVSAFQNEGVDAFGWLWKLVFTVVTLSTGFKGGEVTPLFFIGATLGNAFAYFTGMPFDLFAALGFIAVFAGATNTPLACTLMGVELFGADYLVYFALVCFVSCYFSGHTGIYGAQRFDFNKNSFHRRNQHAPTLTELRSKKQR